MADLVVQGNDHLQNRKLLPLYSDQAEEVVAKEMTKDKYQVSVYKVQNGYLAHISSGDIHDDGCILIARTQQEAARLVSEAIRKDSRPKESDPDYFKTLIQVIRDNNCTHEISIYTTKNTLIVEGYFLSNRKWMTMGNVECDNEIQVNDVVRTMVKNHFTSAPNKKSEINHKGERLIRR